MAGLVAAARARQLGLEPCVLEKGDRAGGSMLLSSCVIWRHRELDDFRRECPDGDPVLQRLILERLDEALAWLVSLGAPVVAHETGNPATTGVRFEPGGLAATLVSAAGDVRLGTAIGRSADGPLLLATGGFPVALARRRGLRLRANPWSEGDGLRYGLARGVAPAGDLDEFYGRNMPDAPFGEEDYVVAAQLYARHAVVLDESGERFLRGPVSWSEADVVQATARLPGGVAWYVVSENALDKRVGTRTVREMIDAAQSLGGTVIPASELPFETPPGALLGVRVRPAVTHTLGGLRVDESARVLRADGSPIEGLFAAGVDVGGIASGGYASGLAQALVLGLVAAETCAGGTGRFPPRAPVLHAPR